MKGINALLAIIILDLLSLFCLVVSVIHLPTFICHSFDPDVIYCCCQVFIYLILFLQYHQFHFLAGEKLFFRHIPNIQTQFKLLTLIVVFDEVHFQTFVCCDMLMFPSEYIVLVHVW